MHIVRKISARAGYSTSATVVVAKVASAGVKRMRTTTRAAVAVAGLVGVVGTVIAADLTGDEIKATISDKTVYLECGATSTGGQGQGIIYYAADGTALYKSARRGMLHGTWAVKGNISCTDWKEVPNNPCSIYDKQGDTITQINVATNQARCKITKTAPGNADKLAP